jgi:hypothetical protein
MRPYLGSVEPQTETGGLSSSVHTRTIDLLKDMFSLNTEQALEAAFHVVVIGSVRQRCVVNKSNLVLLTPIPVANLYQHNLNSIQNHTKAAEQG